MATIPNVRKGILLAGMMVTVSLSCSAQFTGGDDGGHADASLNNAACVPLGPSPFAGGISDGDAHASIMSTICTPIGATPFGGGLADGHAQASVDNTTCTPIGATPFGGGVADGHAQATVVNTTCTPIGATPFGGGVADGHAQVAVINTACTPIGATPFGGGMADGHAQVAVINTACTPIGATPFGGGRADGHAEAAVVNTACTPIGATPFAGGLADGHSEAAKLVIDPRDCSTTLPVELIAFRAECGSGEATITWATATELNNDHFTIERSPDGITFQDIGTVEGAGNSSTTTAYAFADAEPFADITYYRLRQTDIDGTTEHSDVIAIHCMGNASHELLVYPNPTTDVLNIQITENDEPLGLTILSAQGAVVHRGSLTRITTFRTEGLAPGVYVVMVERPATDGRQHHLTQRFIKN